MNVADQLYEVSIKVYIKSYFNHECRISALLNLCPKTRLRKADGNNNDGVTLTKYEISLKVHKRANGRQ